MKCQVNAVAEDLVLRREVLRAVLADDLDAGFRNQRQLGDRDVLRRDDDGDSGPDLIAHALVAVADLLRRRRR